MSEKKFFIYKTTCLLNGKIYIGQCKKTNSKNYLGSGVYIKKAIKKYGAKNFNREILCYCDSIKELNEKEEYYIKLFNSTNLKIGYNFVDVAFCPYKMKESKNYKLNHKESILVYVNSEKGKINAIKRSIAMKEKFSNKEYRDEHSKKLKISCSKKEFRELKSIQTLNFLKSEKSKEAIEKRLEGFKKYNSNPENKVKRLKKLQLYFQSEKFKKDYEAKCKKMIEARRLKNNYPNRKQIIRYSLDGIFLSEHESLSKAAKELNLNENSLRNFRKNNNNIALGYKWAYKNI